MSASSTREQKHPKEPKVPELEKMLAVKEDSHKLGQFLDWLTDEQGITLARREDGGRLSPIPTNWEKLLAQYFDIDLNKVEKERLSLLEFIRQHT